MSQSSLPNTPVVVWDLPLRVFHWLLVATVAFALFTGLVAPHSSLPFHRGAGYAVVALLVFRFVWAAYGSATSRLSSLAFTPAEVVGHFRDLARGTPRPFPGHNPAGAAMVVVAAALLGTLVATGLLAEGGEEKLGPLAGITSYTVGHAAKSVHGVLVYPLIALILGHVIGVLAESRLTGENLILAMISGRKTVVVGAPRPAQTPPLWRAAIRAWGAVVGAAALVLIALDRLPPYGVPAYAPDSAHARECGACHWNYHPALLPAASWAAILASLDDHFGEDASLPPAYAADIGAFLAAYSAERWDTEVGNRFRHVAPGEPQRVTRVPAWVRRHAALPEALFARPDVGGKGNCTACHGDAATGRFDDSAIRVPQ